MNKMKTTIGICAIALLSLTVSCKDNKQQENNEETPSGEMMEHNQSDMNHDNSDGHHGETEQSSERKITSKNAMHKETAGILDAYFQIKNGLVNDNKENTAKAGTALLAELSKFDMSKLTEEAHKEYMDITVSAKEHAEHIVKSPIDHQREHFEALSTDITDLITLLGTDKVVYQDFCPMANNNKGAYWLSEVKEIKNPYFGSKMLTCGSVKKQIN
jgi:hypothetical protein